MKWKAERRLCLLRYQERKLKKKLALIFGGQSGEHEVSCVSAANVLGALDPEKYEITPIGITKDGVWHIYRGPAEKMMSGEWKEDKENLEEDIEVFNVLRDQDVVFPVLHGPMGEDGTIQGLIEMAGVPYVGCGVTASAIGMDKVFSKIVFESAGIPTCDYMAVTRYHWNHAKDQVVKQVEDRLGLPVFVKPANMGSSVGITKAKDEKALIEAIDKAFEYDRRVIIEAFVNAREIETAVLEKDGEIELAFAGEIIPAKEFYDYEAKYQSGDHSKIVIPAELDKKTTDEILAYSRRAFEVIDGTGLSRIDFFVSKDDGKIYINEINTLPGFTDISMYAKMWDKSGVKYKDLVELLVESASIKKNPTLK